MTSKRYDTPPKHRRALEQRLRNVIPHTQLQQRARRQLGYVAVASALMRHARDEHDQPIFLIKGGVAIEVMLGLEARATKDLDSAARLASHEIPGRLADGLARGWDNFTFRLMDLETIAHTNAQRADIKVSYQGDPWSTVQFEVAPTEGIAGREIQWTHNTFLDPEVLGLEPTGELPLVTIAYLIAQKLHACTDHFEMEPNDRYRDLIDIILVDGLLKENEDSVVLRACVEIFRIRDKHRWPPNITVPHKWVDGYRALAEQLDFAPADVYAAAAAVNSIVARIDAAAEVTSVFAELPVQD